ncbi:2-C-methyl-D-erythritol 4-phosphate cytidylyltransferase [Pedobacter xixiisoli]|uniref:2-C-methyl-D-erythritol 4-phosphate cytidylyltransferase n=1 Tax=Pedobacter xixiisoli TaxID=1476464 RepID=A0A285ZRL7_9SPHI|nr:2-C-methyl-D-erythritol 4-phosphate cytidylyltransferase [Pedobacter xixiisoli]SOD12290.1 2-C-methyl-D-erythritol 4-phosphate cytidylyltransferase [Pedobacter xixiisoli]
MKFYAIIVAGGSGKRMQTTIAKQFLLLNNKPVMMHTLQAFYLSEVQPEIILVLSKNDHEYWKDLCLKYNFDIPHTLVEGGKERFHSVRNGLMTIKEDGVVAIHDAVRPVVSSSLITHSFKDALEIGNAIPCIKPSDSVRQLDDNSSKIIDRDKLVLIQTPQTFDLGQLRIAYQQSFSATFTDDASVVEAAGFPINLIEGNRNNIKVTYPEDLELASFLLKNNIPG